tara:strand:+ start:394 stop:2394 length:2001 start_codon:yes stop_codon:yes gene_type:complete
MADKRIKMEYNKKNKDNNRNADSFLFKALTRLLSGPLTKHDRQNPRQLKRWQLDKYKFTSAGGLTFKKTSYNPFDNIYAQSSLNSARAERYVDFDQMEFMPEIASGMDIYADEMTVSSPLQPILTVNCPNEEIKEVLHNLFYSVLNIEFNLYGWCRSMCKYGDYFLYLDVDENIGVKSVIGLPPAEIERLEGEDKTNPNYVQFQWNSGGLTFENWQIAHFRILGNDKYTPYGTSVLESSRRIWRQLMLLEDAMMAYRIVRSPERKVFYIDVGGIPESEVEQHMERIVTQMKRNQVIDAGTGRVDLRYNPMSVDEDYFIPVRGATGGTKIENLPGGTYTGDIDDVKYLRDKLFSALKIPASYLTQGDEGSEDKTTLAQRDIRFARTITRLQRSIVSELEKIAVIHLYTLGYKNKDLISFKLHLNAPSKLAELQELEHWRTKFEVAGGAIEGYFSRRWVAKHIFDLSDQEIVRNQREMFYDKQLDAAYETASMAASSADDMGGMMGGPGGMPELGEDDPASEPAAEDTEEETLLAAPGPEAGAMETPAKRNDLQWKRPDEAPYTTPGAKGKKYTPVKSDKRDMGARKRSYKGKYAEEVGKNTPRNIWKGASELNQLAKGIYEDLETNYEEKHKEEELKILENNVEIQKIIENLEKKGKNGKKNGKVQT